MENDNGSFDPPLRPAIKRYSLRRQEIPLYLEDPETGELQGHVLREMKSTERDLYMNAASGRMKDGGAGVTDFRGLYAQLICRCLYRADLTEDQETGEIKIENVAEKPVSALVINGYPSSTQSELFDECQEINGLNRRARETAKNG